MVNDYCSVNPNGSEHARAKKKKSGIFAKTGVEIPVETSGRTSRNNSGFHEEVICLFCKEEKIDRSTFPKGYGSRSGLTRWKQFAADHGLNI